MPVPLLCPSSTFLLPATSGRLRVAKSCKPYERFGGDVVESVERHNESRVVKWDWLRLCVEGTARMKGPEGSRKSRLCCEFYDDINTTNLGTRLGPCN